MKHNPGFLQIVNDARSRIQEIQPDDLLERIDNGEPWIVIDVREESEWAAGHVRGATYLGRGILERDIESRIPDQDALIALYCGGGYRSALSADMLQKMGYTRVFSLADGWRGWREAGGPVEK